MFFRFNSHITKLLSLSLLLFTFSLSSQAETRSSNILVYGDSLSAAYGLAPEQGWVALLQKRLQTQKTPYHVVNSSVSGETTSGGLARFEQTLKQHQPSVVMLELGANDGLRGLSVPEMRNNLSKMIKLAQNAKAQVILLGIMIPPNYGPRYTRDFKNVYPQLADEFKLKLVPFFLDGVAGKAAYIQEDGLHPNAIAQSKILENIWPTLNDVLSNKTNKH